jgi:DNA adenine methylase
MSVPTRPVFRYHGGKWRLAPWIIAQFPPHRVYVEPFGGAASVLMRKPRSHAEVYNDLDGELVNVFRVLRDAGDGARLRELLRLTPFSRAEYAAAWEESDEPVERARRTLVKAWMGFGSGALTHRHAGFRVALQERRHTAHEWARFSNLIPSFVERMVGVFIEQRPALNVIARFDAPDALLFLDPPYVASTRGPRHRYRHEMTDTEHRELAHVARSARGMVVLSGYGSELYRELYDGWTMLTKRAIDARSRERTEVLWLNPACAGVDSSERAA